MKIVTFEMEGKKKVGVIRGEHVVCLNEILNQPDLTMFQLVEEGLYSINKVQDKVEAADGEPDHQVIFHLHDVSLKAPLENPGKVVCVGNNYMDHCKEQNVEPPEKPLIFSKWTSCIAGPNDSIILPQESKQVDYEAELGVVIQTTGKHIKEETALDHVFGYIIVNDISARDVQFSDGQWVRGKSFDTFAPCGPYLVTADEIGDPQQLSIRTEVNGNTLQDSNTKEMIFSVAHIISYLSNGFTFEPGDLIATGTPHGVGVFRDPQVFLEDGDEVKINIEGLGILTNSCVSE
ncbi:MAG TPA: fumarylacetoacetate hydrolase family protein [Bacillales bacterium]|nr:fumarylacetoacetate hydrolase family protein [Bacillales bacterium]